MKIIRKLKALFYKNEKPISLDLAAAEIKEGRAYLHPKEDRTVTYLVKSDDIEVRLSKGRNLTEKDILVISRPKKDEHDPGMKKENSSGKGEERTSFQKTNDSNNNVNDLSRFKKRTFSVSLYPEEYDRLMGQIQKYGYKRSDFILASAQTATQGTMAKAQKKVVMLRKEIKKEEKAMKQQKNNSNM